ncbi:hypothetical protein F511_27062 [Dorcoceras hygrometricum]|uniref:Uncharacterized protein n=1 Tax=Dorcoceras hygrometricum TaxID=472368 RepID=A0A2Z7B7A1_9LAMI|nr:hypothetical protein F511_27062 [Dorcoceras hygrometricum]
MIPAEFFRRSACIGNENYRNLVKSTLVNGTVGDSAVVLDRGDQVLIVTLACALRRGEKPAVGVSYMQLLVLHASSFRESVYFARGNQMRKELVPAGLECFLANAYLIAPADFIKGKELVPAGRYLLVLSIDLMFSRCYCSPSLSIAISRRFQSLLLTFWVALDSLRLALPIDTSLEAMSNELRNPEGPARSKDQQPRSLKYIENFALLINGAAIAQAAGNDMFAAGCPVVGREKLATGFPNDWLDQTMSYQLIQTTSFAMNPRLVDYITVALVWMHCSSLLVSLERSTCWFLAQNHLLNLTKAKRCRTNLSKRHRFAIANSKYHLLLSAELFFFDTSPADFTVPVPAGSSFLFSACSWLSSFQLVHYAPAGST